jgi:hypothetical protein
VEQCKTIHICADFSEKDQIFTVHQDKLSPLELFALICIQEKELLYICIRIFNEFIRPARGSKQDGRMRYPLKNTFGIVSSKRDNNARKYLNNCWELDNYIFESKDKINENLE